MKKGYGLQLIGIGVLSVCTVVHASVPTVRIVSSYEMLSDDNAITYPQTSRLGTFSMIVTDAPVSTEEIIVSEPEYLWTCNPSSGDFSFSENGAYAHMFLGDKAFGTVYTVKGEVKWEVTDTEPDPDSVSTVAASDVITLDTPLFDFTVVSDPYDGNGVGQNASGKDVLTDNRTATVTVSARGYSNLAHINSVSFTSTQADPGNVLNKKGTGITFTQDGGSILKWKTTRTYWYGLAPAKCCWSNSHAYKFEMTVNGCCKTSHVYSVGMPKGNASVSADFERYSKTIIYAPEPFLQGINRFYLCNVQYGDFIKTYEIHGLPSTDQYAEEAEKEENYHVQQWLGQVPSDQGGQGDILTGQGIKWFAKSKIGASDYVLHGDYFTAARMVREAVDYGEKEEAALSMRSIWERDRGFVEVKAKEHAGYNAAFKYHCTYEDEYGPAHQQINHVHPAYQ